MSSPCNSSGPNDGSRGGGAACAARRLLVGLCGLLASVAAFSNARAQASPATPAGTAEGTPTAESTVPEPEPNNYPWLDDIQQFLYGSLWRAAEHVDRWFGSEEPDAAYEQGAYGSIAPAILWDQYHGVSTLLRFQANIPLPQINEKFSAFVGRLNPEEYISESQPYSGAFPNPYAPNPRDQTILGIQYQQPKLQGASWDYGAGMPVTLHRFDPYVKGGYNYALGEVQHGLLYWRQDIFYQDSQGGFGVTSTLYLQQLFGQSLLLGWTGSTTRAQRSYGWRSYSTFDAIYAFPNERAIDLELEVDGATRLAVPLHDYGGKLAYRRSILRDWLVLEVRTSLDWPKDFPNQRRQTSFGVGLGFEMYFGTYQFQARSVTF